MHTNLISRLLYVLPDTVALAAQWVCLHDGCRAFGTTGGKKGLATHNRVHTRIAPSKIKPPKTPLKTDDVGGAARTQQCVECGRSFTNSSNLQQHISKTHAKGTENAASAFCCPYLGCKDVFTNLRQCTNHADVCPTQAMHEDILNPLHSTVCYFTTLKRNVIWRSLIIACSWNSNVPLYAPDKY